MYRKWKTRIIYGVLPVLAIAILLATAICGQVSRGHAPHETSATAQVSSPQPSAPGGKAQGDLSGSMDATQACMYIAPRMVRAWADDSLDGELVARAATIGDKPEPMPDMTAAQYTGGLLASTGTTATCMVDTGGVQPFTVGLRLENGQWSTALLRVPGSDRP